MWLKPHVSYMPTHTLCGYYLRPLDKTMQQYSMYSSHEYTGSSVSRLGSGAVARERARSSTATLKIAPWLLIASAYLISVAHATDSAPNPVALRGNVLASGNYMQEKKQPTVVHCVYISTEDTHHASYAH